MDVRQWLKKQIVAAYDQKDKFTATSDTVTFGFGFESTLNYINDLEKELSKARQSDASSQEMLDIILKEIVHDLGPGSPHSEALAKAARREKTRREFNANWREFF